MSLRRLFDPDAVAVVGASTTPGKLGHEAMANLVAFDGSVVPVNPNEEGELFGEPFVASVAETNADMAVLCVPPDVIPEVLADCGEADVGGAVVCAGGFAEAGNETLQECVRETAQRHDISLLGPNTSGFLRPGKSLYASFVGGVEEIAAGGVAVLAQSGGVAHAMAFRALREGRGLSAMVGLGNRANTDFPAVIEYFDADAETSAIVLHVEGTADARALFETCRSVETPVIAYSVDADEVATFAESHTGALTGAGELYRAGFRQFGVPTVERSVVALDVGEALATGPVPDGPGVGVVTAQAGPGIIIAERLTEKGVDLPDLSDDTRAAVDEHLPGITYAENPVDTGRPMPAFGEVVRAVAEDDAVDVVVVSELYEPGLGFPTTALEGLPARTGTPVVFATEGTPPEGELAALRNVCSAVCLTPERAADCALALGQYGQLHGGDDDG